MAFDQKLTSYDDATHTYRYHGAPVISVTQAIKAAGLIDSEWFTEYARERGRAVHLATQFDDEGSLDEETVSDTIRPYLDGYRKFRADTRFQPELIEHRVWNLEHGYAGTLDRAGLIDKKLKILLDLKSGACPFWSAYQTAGYCFGLRDAAAYTRYVVQLTSEGAYKITTYAPKTFREHLADFLAIVRVAQIAQEHCRQETN